jgi:phage recombination protein Bet
MSDLTVYCTDTGEIKLSPGIVKNYLVSGSGKVSDQEVMMFIALCKFQHLNPFLREAYLIKFGSSPATMVVGKEVFTKRASKLKECAGWEAGVTITTKDGQIERRAGTLVLKNETLVGGWCKVYRHDWKVPMEHEVSMSEFNKGQSSWKSMPATMIRKVAIVSALRDTFPDSFQGMYDSSEMKVDEEKLPVQSVTIEKAEQEKQAIDKIIRDNEALSNRTFEEIEKGA